MEITVVIKRTSLSRLKKNRLFLSVVVVVLAHVLAFAAQFALILLIPSWPPSSVVRQFPFNVIDTISGVISSHTCTSDVGCHTPSFWFLVDRSA